jgi:DNA mismatch endonuclease (patch repair protein)
LWVRPDIVFAGSRLAVFIDGCFWHGCPEHGTSPGVNQPYWVAKLAMNRDRDERVVAHLERAGWRVVRIWEHTPTSDAVALVARMVEKGRDDERPKRDT